MKRAWFVATLVALAAGCGGGDDSNGSPQGGVLVQAPHCLDSFQVEGTLDGVAVDDLRTTNVNAGLVNIGTPKFDTPISTLVPLASNQIELHLTWTGSLAYGDFAPLTGKSLVAPANHPRAGQQLCITDGEVGFASGGREDGGFKFHITKLRSGADCSVDVPVDLRGCFN